ncbi:AP-4 complex subunit epsilon-1 [Geodia barretti]|nr:AP-4 complex subunit epsilon-1 [Geodia barretti]
MNFDPLIPVSSGGSAGGGGGLLGGMEIRQHQNKSPTFQGEISTPPTIPPTNSTSADLLGLSFDDMVTVPTDKQQPQPQLEPTMAVMAPHISSDISLLEPTPSTTVPEVSEPKGSLALNLLETPLTSLKVPDEYSQLPPVAGWTNKDVCQDASLRLTVTKLVSPDQLVVVLFLTNQKQASLSDVTLSLKPSSNLTAKASSGVTDLSFKTSLTGFATGVHVVTLVPSSPAPRMSLQGQVAYSDAMATNKRLFFDASLLVSDFIRPLGLSTQEYGKKWPGLSNERTLNIQSSPNTKTVAQFMDTLRSRLSLHPIQIIGQEGIAAGTFLPKIPCLVHGKVTSANLDLRVRTPSSLLTDSLAKLAEQVFK